MALEESRQNGLILGTERFHRGQLWLLIHQARPSDKLQKSNEASCITLESLVEGHLYDRVHLGDGARPLALPDGDLFSERLGDRCPEVGLTAGAPTAMSRLSRLELRVLRRPAVSNFVGCVFSGMTRGLAFHRLALHRARANLGSDGA